jgi:hypothetical protein
MAFANSLRWPDKDPSEIVDYQLDWTPFLGADTIATSVWTAPTGFTINAQSNTDTTATVWLAGGLAGAHQITNRITTTGGRTFERSVALRVAEL